MDLLKTLLYRTAKSILSIIPNANIIARQTKRLFSPANLEMIEC
jgi:hypothetical protein